MKVISWNIAQRDDAWRRLLDLDADIALLQEAAAPPSDVADKLEVDPEPWRTAGEGRSRPWRTAVVRLSNRVEVEWIEPKSIEAARPGQLAVSRPGTVAAATVTGLNLEPLTLVSLYGSWEQPLAETGSRWIYADASVHRLVSDLSVFIGRQRCHRIIAAGDLNILHGYGEHGSSYWATRYETVFRRLAALGLCLLGPQAPAGRVAHPWPAELPSQSKNVPTFHARHQTPATATRQLDFVFCSEGLSERVSVKAQNEPEDWGPSDHCRVEIDVA